ncbi:glycosyltransferase family 9 protein [Flavivirga jejuensis]
MIGDVLTSSILFEALRLKYPKAQLDYLINEHTFPVVKNNPFIDNFIFFTKEIDSSKKTLYKFAKTIKRKKHDIIIDVYSKFSSSFITLLSGAKTKISKRKWYTSFIYSHTFKEAKIPKTNAGLAIENRLQFLEPLGINASEIYKPKIFLTDSEITKGKKLLEDKGIDLSKPLFMIAVLGSHANKTYPLENMAKVIDNVVNETNGQVLFNYIPNQETDAKNIFDLCNSTSKEHIFFDVFGNSLREFLTLTYHCNALIGNEGGATNMAKALDKPTFTIFSTWINKDSWNMFDNETTNISVHLKDYKPNLYSEVTHLKELKQDAKKLYSEFTQDLFEDQLKKFLKQF